MYIKKNKHKYKFNFDLETTSQLVALLFSYEFDTRENKYFILDDLILLLFTIDIEMLQTKFTLVTGEEYYFNKNGILCGYYFDKVIWSCFDIKFELTYNKFNKIVITLKDLGSFTYDNISPDLAELAAVVHNSYRYGSIYKYRYLFNNNTVIGKSKPGKCVITLDYLIMQLDLSDQDIQSKIIENIALHNFKLS